MWLSPAILESNHLGIHPGCFSICNKLTRVFSCTTFGHFENSFPKKNRGLILPHQLSEHIKKGVKSQDVAIYPHTVVFGLASYEVIAVIDCNICNTSCFLEELLEKRCCLPAQVTRNPSFVGTFFSFDNKTSFITTSYLGLCSAFPNKTQHHSQKYIGSIPSRSVTPRSRVPFTRLGSLNGQRRLTPSSSDRCGLRVKLKRLALKAPPSCHLAGPLRSQRSQRLGRRVKFSSIPVVGWLVGGVRGKW